MRRGLGFLLAAALPLAAEVGVEEKLGAEVPASLELVAEDGRRVRLGDLLDRPTLLTLNYFRCAGICTPQLNGLTDALDRIQGEPGFQVLTVSFDPRDTPAIAARKRDNYLHQLHRPWPAGSWRFLTGEAGATRALADAVGFRFQAQGEDFAHPAVVVVLGPPGRVSKYIYGISYLPAELQLAAREAARGGSSPSIAKVLSLCFRYDPSARKEVFSLTRACAAALVAGALGFLVWLAVKGRRRTEP